MSDVSFRIQVRTTSGYVVYSDSETVSESEFQEMSSTLSVFPSADYFALPVNEVMYYFNPALIEVAAVVREKDA